jgi:putative transcriptional regulator
MLLNLERLDFLIAQHVAGSLPEPAEILVGSHLEMQRSSRRFADALEAMAGDALEQAEAVPLTSRDKQLANIMTSAPMAATPESRNHEATKLPSPLFRYTGRDLPQIPWKTKLPGFKQHVISRTDEAEASLLWVRPGRALPHHSHHGLELTLVLEGEFHDHRGNFSEGAVSVADESLDHRPVAGTNRPCVCFSVLFAPIALTGPTLRLVSDIIGL